MNIGHIGTKEFERFQIVIEDLEKRGCTVKVLAYVNTKDRRWDTEREIDYTIEAHFPSGKVWEIIEIQ
jgi:hypothetical protein